MKKMRLLSLAVVPMFLAQCGPQSCTPAPPPEPAPIVGQPSDDCNPNYTPCVPNDSDVDCAGGSGNGPSYVRGPVRVIGVDVYDLDGNDHDGIGCEDG
jgi:hypothetical protein